MDDLEELMRITLINYLVEMLKAHGISLETTKRIMTFLANKPDKMMEMMDWFGEHLDEKLSESQIIYALNQVLHNLYHY